MTIVDSFLKKSADSKRGFFEPIFHIDCRSKNFTVLKKKLFVFKFIVAKLTRQSSVTVTGLKEPRRLQE